MANVTFTLDADEAKAVNGFLKVVDAQKKTEKGMRKITKQSNKFSSSLKRMAGSFIAFASVGALIRGVSVSIGEQKERISSFEDEMTSLLALGDNTKNITNVKNAVLDLSNASGIASSNVASAFFQIQSGASHLSKTIQNELVEQSVLLSKVTGTDLPLATVAATKAYLIFGDQLGSVAATVSKLNKVADLGFMSFQDIANFMPDVMSAAKATGVSFEELGAGLIVATKAGGKNATTFNAYKNILLRMHEAEKLGIVSTGSLTKKLQDLASQPQDMLLKIFGLEGFTTLQNLITGTGQLKSLIQEINKTPINALSEKQYERLKDTSFLFSEMSKQIRNLQKNILTTPRSVEKYGATLLEHDLRILAGKERGPLTPDFVIKGTAIIQTAVAETEKDIEKMAPKLTKSYEKLFKNIFQSAAVNALPDVVKLLILPKLARLPRFGIDDNALRKGKQIQREAIVKTSEGRVKLTAQESFLEGGDVSKAIDKMVVALDKNTKAQRGNKPGIVQQAMSSNPNTHN